METWVCTQASITPCVKFGSHLFLIAWTQKIGVLSFKVVY